MAAGILAALHLLVCAGVGVMMKAGKIKTKNLILPTVVFVPVWGLLLLFLEEYEASRKRMGTKEMGLESFKIQDVKYQRIQMDENQNEEITVPLEEALLVNDASVRRKLMMDILHRNPEEYIELLQKTRTADDTELTHYATTTMMEIQGKYEARIHELGEVLAAEPENVEIMKKSRRVLKKYINSGLLSGNILEIYRKQLDELEEMLLRRDPENQNYTFERFENRIALGDFEGMEEELNQAVRRWPEEERVYQIYVEYYWHMRQGEKIREILEKIKTEHVYLTSEGKKWYEFWDKKELGA